MTQRIAVIDLGSNSARLIVMHIYYNGAYNLVYNQKESVRLSQGMGETNTLQPEAIEKAILTLKIFSDMCHLFEVNKIIAVATAAVRNAVNGQEFIELIERKVGIEFRIISGTEEAYLGYLGSINTMDISNAILFDLGGGSTELTLIRDRQIEKSLSLPFGAVNLTEKFSTNDKISAKTLSAIHKFLAGQLRKIKWLNNCGLPLIGVGGTARNIAKMDQKRKNYPLPKIHNYRLGKMSFDDLYEMLIITNHNQRRKIPGLNNERADIIVAGSSIIKSLFDITGSTRLLISGCGVREGLFFDYYFTRSQEKKVLDDILDHSTNNMLLFYKVHTVHAHHVTKIAQRLFDDWQPLHKLGTRERQLMTVAAMLHDIGITINYYDHSRHSAYLIENARLFGLTHREQMLAAVIAGWHSGYYAKFTRYRLYTEFLDDQDWLTARKLALIVAIAEALDATQTGLISNVSASLQDDTAVIHIESTGSPVIEMQTIHNHIKWFKKEFGLILEVNIP